MKKKIIIIIAVIVVLALTCFTIDYMRVKNNQKPLCAIKFQYFSDGGQINEESAVYYGLGYKVMGYVNLTITEKADDFDAVTRTFDYKMANLFEKVDYERINKNKQILLDKSARDAQKKLLVDKNGMRS